MDFEKGKDFRMFGQKGRDVEFEGTKGFWVVFEKKLAGKFGVQKDVRVGEGVHRKTRRPHKD